MAAGARVRYRGIGGSCWGCQCPAVLAMYAANLRLALGFANIILCTKNAGVQCSLGPRTGTKNRPQGPVCASNRAPGTE